MRKQKEIREVKGWGGAIWETWGVEQDLCKTLQGGFQWKATKGSEQSDLIQLEEDQYHLGGYVENKL